MRIKIDKKALLAAARRAAKPEKKNFTHRLTISNYKNFALTCKKEGTTPTDVLEEFLKQFSTGVN